MYVYIDIILMDKTDNRNISWRNSRLKIGMPRNMNTVQSYIEPGYNC